MPETLLEQRKWGYFPDVPAIEDKRYSVILQAEQRPDSVNLISEFKNEIEDQGQLGSCVANSCIGALEYLIAKKHRSDVSYKYPELSRLFAYWYARKVRGLQTVDQGAVIRDCVDQLQSIGVCEESVWPYVYGSVNTQPDSFAYEDAVRNKAGSSYRVDDLDSKLDCLAQGYPFVFGFMVYNESMKQAGRTAVMPMPSGGRAGGHAVLAVGYDVPRRLFLIRNSWGKNWGDKGYFWMPFDYLTNADLSSDYWTIRTFGE